MICELWLRKLERANRTVPESSQAGYASSGPVVSATAPDPSAPTTQILLATPETELVDLK